VNKSITVKEKDILFLLQGNSSIQATFKKFYNLKKKMGIKKAIKIITGYLGQESSFVINSGDVLIVVRDYIGSIPIYFFQNRKILAITNERKLLWNIGLVGEKIIEPGSTYYFNGCKVNKTRNFSITNRKMTISLEKAVQLIQRLLFRSIKKMMNYDKTGICFSGGLDSSILAKISCELGHYPTLYCSGIEGERDVQNAKKSSDLLGMRLSLKTISVNDVKKNLPNLILASEDLNPNKLGIAFPLFFSSLKAKSEGIKNVLSGQGADELYGGYKRYERIIREKGYKVFERMLKNDIINLSNNSLEIDKKVGLFHSVNVFFPYLDAKLVNISFNLPPEYKVSLINNVYIRKYILRKVAENLRMPKEIIEVPKIASQFGSGCSKAITLIARKEGFDRNFANKFGYRSYERLYIETLAYFIGIPFKRSKVKMFREIESLKKNW
jgi:asparagine synthase (glutamine-hydrolysing)